MTVVLRDYDLENARLKKTELVLLIVLELLVFRLLQQLPVCSEETVLENLNTQINVVVGVIQHSVKEAVYEVV